MVAYVSWRWMKLIVSGTLLEFVMKERMHRAFFTFFQNSYVFPSIYVCTSVFKKMKTTVKIILCKCLNPGKRDIMCFWNILHRIVYLHSTNMNRIFMNKNFMEQKSSDYSFIAYILFCFLFLLYFVDVYCRFGCKMHSRSANTITRRVCYLYSSLRVVERLAYS